MYPVLILNSILTCIFFPLVKMIGEVRSRSSFMLSSRSWEIGSHPIGAVQEGWCSLVSCPHRSYTSDPFLRKDPPPQCELCQCILTIRHILVECNHFVEKRKDIFGKRNVMNHLDFIPHTFYYILIYIIFVITKICTALYIVFINL